MPVLFLSLLALILHRRYRRVTKTTETISEMAADPHVVYEMQDTETAGATELPAGRLPVEMSAVR